MIAITIVPYYYGINFSLPMVLRGISLNFDVSVMSIDKAMSTTKFVNLLYC
jgi:hypothetical protein